MAIEQSQIEPRYLTQVQPLNRVTKELIESRIQEVDFETVVIAGKMMMFCGIRMDNDFVAVGPPATCIDPDNWCEDTGQKESYKNSFEELWKLEAYRRMSTKPGRLSNYDNSNS
ncbi:Gp49 family protein [Hahella ganghwensis]|uniref:Gp49 family protein n=1 Tax=Hahella ganghwensis TaxID=286420 RepID=UPI00037F2406|nr:Gp49 family protein [Hahella ganghwensis]